MHHRVPLTIGAALSAHSLSLRQSGKMIVDMCGASFMPDDGAAGIGAGSFGPFPFIAGSGNGAGLPGKMIDRQRAPHLRLRASRRSSEQILRLRETTGTDGTIPMRLVEGDPCGIMRRRRLFGAAGEAQVPDLGNPR